MSARHGTVGELIERLRQFPEDMQVCTLWPGQRAEWRNEGNLVGITQFDVVTAGEVRSGWFYNGTETDLPEMVEPIQVLVLSEAGVDWCESEVGFVEYDVTVKRQYYSYNSIGRILTINMELPDYFIDQMSADKPVYVHVSQEVESER
jgi:hypothetical protein